MKEKIKKSLERIRTEKPLVHCMTNTVVTEFNANALLALGALPVMAYAKEEIEEMAQKAGAVLLNIGTLTSELADAMIIAGQSANKVGVPVIFDPVGTGATKFRYEHSKRILKEVKVDILKGNPGEIGTLLNIETKMKGVESGETSILGSELALECAKKYNLVCAITGKKDYVSDGKRVFELNNGHGLLNKVVGTGCTVGAFCGAFAAVEKDFVAASLGALGVMSVCGERAFNKSGFNPGTFKTFLLDDFYHITGETLVEKMNFSIRD